MKDKKKTVCWMLVTPGGVPKIINAQLPIYYYKGMADSMLDKFPSCSVKRLELSL